MGERGGNYGLAFALSFKYGLEIVFLGDRNHLAQLYDGLKHG